MITGKMNYIQKTITIPTDQGLQTATAMEAEGTGLAIVQQKNAFGTYYNVTTLNAENRAIVNWKDINSEQLAKLFLEEIAKVVDCSSPASIQATANLDKLYNCFWEAQRKLA